MEVINSSSAMLSNFEVFSLLSDIQGGRGQKKPTKGLQQLATITYETMKYLEDKPCSDQSTETMEQFLKDVEQFELTKAEKLQLLNLFPTTAVEIQLIVEESEERLTEQQIYDLLEIISKYRPSSEADEEEAGCMDDENEFPEDK